MSLVGPRPALHEETAAFDAELQARFRYRPGITGLCQVEALSNASFEAYRRFDLRDRAKAEFEAHSADRGELEAN